jgi:hypothetical protein
MPSSTARDGPDTMATFPESSEVIRAACPAPVLPESRPPAVHNTGSTGTVKARLDVNEFIASEKIKIANKPPAIRRLRVEIVLVFIVLFSY